MLGAGLQKFESQGAKKLGDAIGKLGISHGHWLLGAALSADASYILGKYTYYRLKDSNLSFSHLYDYKKGGVGFWNAGAAGLTLATGVGAAEGVLRQFGKVGPKWAMARNIALGIALGYPTVGQLVLSGAHALFGGKPSEKSAQLSVTEGVKDLAHFVTHENEQVS